MKVIIDQQPTVLQVLTFGQHVGRYKDVHFPVRPSKFRTVVGPRSEGFDEPDSLSRGSATIYSADQGIPGVSKKICTRLAGQLAVEVAGCVAVIGEYDDLLTLEVPRKQVL